MICDACRGLGWLHDGDWPEKCATCKGAGRLSRSAVAEALNIDVGTLKRIERGRARRSTYARVFERLAKIL